MVLTKDELLTALGQEVRVIVHLASKAEGKMRDYFVGRCRLCLTA